MSDVDVDDSSDVYQATEDDMDWLRENSYALTDEASKLKPGWKIMAVSLRLREIVAIDDEVDDLPRSPKDGMDIILIQNLAGMI